MTSIHDQTLVIGAGPAGTAAAAALSRIGLQVVVVEREAGAAAEGAGIQLTPNGMAALDGIGLGGAVRKIGTPASAVELCDFKSGKVIFRFELDRYVRRAGAPYLLAHRADLQRVLIDSAKKQGAEFKFGCEFDSRTFNFDERTFDRELGIGRVAAVVAAEGGRSKARAALNPTENQAFPSHVAWRCLIGQDRMNTDQGSDVVRLTMGPGRHVVSYWLRGRSELNAVLVANNRILKNPQPSSADLRAELVQTFGDFGGCVPNIVEAAAAVTKWRLFGNGLPGRWHDDRMVLLGDALHPMLPFLAQGANMAFEDAWELSRSFARNSLVEDAFREYKRRRIGRLEKTIRAIDRQSRIHESSNPMVRSILAGALGIAGVALPSVLAARFDWLFGKNVAAD